MKIITSASTHTPHATFKIACCWSDIINILTDLQSHGITIILITARNEWPDGINRKITEKNLKALEILYDSLLMTNHDDRGKGPYILEYINQNPGCRSLFIDNFPENLWSAAYFCTNSMNIQHFVLFIADAVQGIFDREKLIRSGFM